jgi:hypothetical protein
VLITLNVADYPPILREWALSGKSHAGVILVHGVRPSDVEATVVTVARALSKRPNREDWLNRAIVATPNRDA